MDRERTYSGSYGQVTVSGKKAVKRGQVSTWEVSNLRRLNDTGVTPRYLRHQWKKKCSREEEDGTIMYEGVLEMEALDGYRPVTLLRPDDVSYPVIAELFVEAMARMHLQGVAHLDMHGRNVMYNTARRSVAIVDFGRSWYNYRLAFLEAVACLVELWSDYNLPNRPEFNTKIPMDLNGEYYNPEGRRRVLDWLSSFCVRNASYESTGPELDWKEEVETLYKLLGVL